MPEHRARKHHQDRVAEALKDEIGAMIEGELSDPRIDFCHVSEVALNPGGKSARVYVALDTNSKDIAKAEEETIAGLEAAKGYIRRELKDRMGVRHVPELEFSGRSVRALPGAHRTVDEPGPQNHKHQARPLSRRRGELQPEHVLRFRRNLLALTTERSPRFFLLSAEGEQAWPEFPSAL